MIRILVVDDERGYRDTLSRFLEREGYSVVAADCVASARTLLADDPVDIVLTDIVMPGENGIELLRTIREHYPSIKTILLTGEPTLETATEAVREGAVDYISKPIDRERLLKVVANTVTIMELERQNFLYQNQLEALVEDRTREIVSLYRKLELSQANYRMLVENQRDVLVRIRLDGTIEYCSPSIEPLLGYTQEQAVGGFAIWNISDPELRQKALQKFFESLAAGESLRYDVAHGKDPQRIVSIEVVGTPLYQDTGLIGFQCILRDVTERRKAEEALRRSEERFRALAEHSEDVIMRFDRAHKHLYVNPAVETLTGIKQEDFLGKTHREIGFPEDLCILWEKTIDRVLDSGSSHRIVFQLPNGAWLDWSLVPETVDAGGQVQTVVTSARDMTRLLQAEEKLKHMASAIENAAEDVLLTDLEGRITYVNPAFTAITGYTPEEVIGQTPRILKSGLHSEAFYADLWSTLAAGKVWKGRVSNRTKDGRIIIQDAVVSPIRSEEGHITGYSAIRRDITEQLELEAKFLQAQKMEALGLLAGGIAHDFNNILGAIIGNAELSLMEVPKDSPVGKDLQTILQASERAVDLVSQILAFSRETTRDRSPLAIGMIVKETTKLLRATLPRNIRLVQAEINADLKVLADPIEVHQVLMNLCTNALHAMEEQGGTLTIRATAASHQDHLRHFSLENREGASYLLLCITDTGKGIAAEHLSRIFDPFFTTKAPGKGTGLGLAAVHGIVKSLGGQIHVESSPGQGTGFSILLPTVDRDVIEALEADSTLPTGYGKVLVVDDEEAILRFTVGLLRRLGYETIAATDGLSAWEHFHAQPDSFSCVLTDQMMPGLSGLTLISRIREMAPKLPVILGSGFINEETRRQAEEMGVDSILEKPYRTHRLANELRRVITRAVREL